MVQIRDSKIKIKEKTRNFYKMLCERSKKAKEKPELLVPFEDI